MMEDDIEEQGEISRKNILAAMAEAGLDDALLGRELAGIVKDAGTQAKIKLDAIALAISLKSAMPKRVQKHKIQSEQRVLRVTYQNGALPMDAERLKRLKPTERALLLDLTAKMENPDDGS